MHKIIREYIYAPTISRYGRNSINYSLFNSKTYCYFRRTVYSVSQCLAKCHGSRSFGGSIMRSTRNKYERN